jgi:MFS family permease
MRARRVMALWAVAWLGSTPIGGPIVGWVGEELGARWSLIIGGVPTLVVGIVTYPILARVGRRRSERTADGSPARQGQQ